MTQVPPFLPQGLEHLAEIDVFVWCGGKCGGSTLRATFEEAGLRVLHTHGPVHFNAAVVRRPDVNLFDVFDHAARTRPRVLVVDAYRLPIERKISSFFQNIEQHVPSYRRLPLPRLMEVFNERFLGILEGHHPINRIFDHCGLPRFDSFDFARGCNVARHGTVEFVKLRFADIADWGRILSGVLNRPIVIRSENRTELKPVYDLYRRFLAASRLPEGFLDRHVASDEEFLIHTTAAERDAYLESWRARSRAPDEGQASATDRSGSRRARWSAAETLRKLFGRSSQPLEDP